MKYFIADSGEVIKFSAVISTAPQRDYKRVVHLYGGNHVVLYGVEGDQFLDAFKHYARGKNGELQDAEIEEGDIE